MRTLLVLTFFSLAVGDSQAFGRRRARASEPVYVQPTHSSVSSGTPLAASEDFGQTLLALHNSERARSGLASLTLSTDLNREAGAGAAEQARRGRIGHWLGIRSGSENAAQGQTSESETHYDWMRSPGHRANILGPWSEVGFARCGSFWTARYR